VAARVHAAVEPARGTHPTGVPGQESEGGGVARPHGIPVGDVHAERETYVYRYDPGRSARLTARPEPAMPDG